VSTWTSDELNIGEAVAVFGASPLCGLIRHAAEFVHPTGLIDFDQWARSFLGVLAFATAFASSPLPG